MNKKILSVALATLFTLGFSAMAQDKATTEKKECAKECTIGGKCKADGKDKKGKCCKEKAQCKEGMQRKAPNPFEGLNLTEAQQQQISAIVTPQQVLKAARSEKQDKADTAMTPQVRRQMVKDVRANYLNQVKAVLTPEQYVQFLENNYVNAVQGKPGKGGKDMKKGEGKDFKKGDRKGGKDMKKGDRKGGQQRQERQQQQ